jgi:hypothetical protein
MMHRTVPFVVCHTLPEILRLSPSAIDKLGTEFCLCDCQRCGKSIVIGVDELTNVGTLDLEIICAKCAVPSPNDWAGPSKPN